MSFGMVAASYLGVVPSGGGLSPYANAVLADNPLAFYQLDETSGTTMLDSSGNGRNGTYSGGVVLGEHGVNTTAAGRSVLFDNDDAGTTEYQATVPYASWMNTTELTVAFSWWVQDAYWLGLIASRYGEPGNDWSWYVYRRYGTIQFHYRSSGGVNTQIDTYPFYPEQGVRYYIAAYVSAAGCGLRIYDDNGLVTQVTSTGGTLNSSSRPLTLMNAATGGYTAGGWLDDVAVFGTALSTSRLDQLAGIAFGKRWLNRSAGVSDRNGTAAHTANFTAASSGSFLVAVVSTPGTTTATTPGWTKRLGAYFTGNTELSVFTRTASAGDASLSLTVSDSNVPLHYVVYEFPPGSAWHSSATNTYSAAYPQLTGLPGTPVMIFVASSARQSPGDTSKTGWSYWWHTDLSQATAHNGVTLGVFTGIGYVNNWYGTTVGNADLMNYWWEDAPAAQRTVFALTIPS